LINIINILKSDIFFSKGQDNASKGFLDEAIREFNRSLLLDPKNSALLLHKALALSDKGQYTEAVSTIEKAMAIKPNNSVYYLFLGRVHYDHKMLNDALNALDQSLRMDSNNVLALCFKNLTILNMGYSDSAYDVIKREFVNTNSEFRGRLLYFCESLLNGRIRNAESISNVKPKDDQQRGGITQSLVGYFYSLRKLLYRIRYAFNEKTQSAYFHYLEGSKKYILDDSAKAIDEFKNALRIFPEFKPAKARLIDLYFENGDYANLTKLFEIDGSLNKSDSQSDELISMVNDGDLDTSGMVMLGISFYNLREYEKSIKYLKFAIKDGLKDFKTFYYLGLCYLALNDVEGAQPYFRKASDGIETNFFKERLEEMKRVCVEKVCK
jgi:tetratricopeptide (TPR) repeat protein